MNVVAAAGPRGIVPYLRYLRPAEWPLVTAHAFLGWFLAAGLQLPDARTWLGIAVWVVLLNGGALALNSAFDDDQSDPAFLQHPPPLPRFLAGFGVAMITFGFFATDRLPAMYRTAYVIGAVIAIAYSVPPVRLRSVVAADWVASTLGFGALTLYAGWGITGQPLHGTSTAVLGAFVPLFAGLYPLLRLYRVDEDRANGRPTIATRLGFRAAISVAVFCVGIAFGMLTMAGWSSAWRDRRVERWGALVVAAMAWAVVAVPWSRNARVWSTAEHRRARTHALAAWVLTEIAVLLAWAD